MPTISEERDAVVKMLRRLCRSAASLPPDIQTWWDAEKVLIAEETAAADARKAERVNTLTARIAELQAQLDALT